ncbi:MAG: hypothetical protein K8T20_15585 [Planctomycetes bacterium]|nr:hypothetical protein [Planctomycetota bacterium]
MTLEHASVPTLFLSALGAFAAPRAFGQEPGGTPGGDELKQTLDDAWGE